MSLEDEFINELKLQAYRDLEGAENLLTNNGHIEHLAWHCEQGYEKLVKYVYAYFKLKFQKGRVESVDEKMREKIQHRETYKLILNMFREIFGHFTGRLSEIWVKIESGAPPETSAYLRRFMDANVPNNIRGDLDRRIDSIESKIRSNLSTQQAFEFFIGNSTQDGESEALRKIDRTSKVNDYLANLGKDLFKSQDPMISKASVVMNPQLWIDFYTFAGKGLVLASWILPHVSMARYPLIEYNFQNLKAYRERTKELRPFFEYLTSEVKELGKSADKFIDSLDQIKKYVHMI